MASCEWRDWHLTPDNWQRGSHKRDDGSATLRDPPGSVGVWVYSEEIPSPVGASIKCEVEEGPMTGTEEEIAALLAKFGPCPRSL